MTIPATDTAIDVAYWFFNRAEKDGLYLETDVMQHLLFLAQLHFAINYNMQLLTPSLFVCDHTGFYEPNLKRMFAFGRPFMPAVKFPDKIELFLESVWAKYGKLSLLSLQKITKSNPAFKEMCISGTVNTVDFNVVVKHFIEQNKKSQKNNAFTDARKKVLFSQNGPVVVSQWQPRKVDFKP